MSHINADDRAHAAILGADPFYTRCVQKLESCDRQDYPGGQLVAQKAPSNVARGNQTSFAHVMPLAAPLECRALDAG
jgi:hypothetical protein